MTNKNISTSKNDCGKCAINNLLRFYNKSLYFKINNKNGFTLKDMKFYLKKYFKVVLPAKITLKELKKADTQVPFILLMKNNNEFHYVVVYKIKNDFFYILDSLKKKSYRVNTYKLESIYSGYCLMVDDFIKQEAKKIALFKLPKRFFLIPLFSFIESLVLLSMTVVLQQVIDNNFTELYLYLFIHFLLLFIISYKVKEYLKLWTFIDINVINDIFFKIYHLDYCFILQNDIDELYYRIFDAYSLKNMILSFIFDFFNDFILAICTIVLLFVYQYQLAFLLLFLLIPICIFTLFIYKKNQKVIEDKRQSEYKFISNYRDSFKNIEDLYQLRNESYYHYNLPLLKKFQEKDFNLQKLSLFKNKILFFSQSLVTMVVVFFYVNNTFVFLSTGSLIAILNLLNLLFQPLLNLCSQITNFSNYTFIKKRLQDL